MLYLLSLPTFQFYLFSGKRSMSQFSWHRDAWTITSHRNRGKTRIRRPFNSQGIPSSSRRAFGIYRSPFLVCKFSNLLFLNILFYWSIVDLQCCVNFCCRAKWFSNIYFFFHVLFHPSLSQGIKHSFLCYTVGPCCLPTLYIIVCIC